MAGETLEVRRGWGDLRGGLDPRGNQVLGVADLQDLLQLNSYQV